jgi:hypothetical protein
MVRPDPRPLLGIVITATLLGGCAAPGTTPADADPTLAPVDSAAPTVFSSSVLPYSLRLPDGWVANASAEGEDSYDSADGRITLTVGTGRPEPGQTVEDRVRINREDEFGDCVTDPSQDRPVTIGGERAIQWAFDCGGVVGLAANTIHDSLGYRLTLRAPAGDAPQLEPLMAEILANYRFTDEAAGYRDRRTTSISAKQLVSGM